jgi:hypothetical protein
VKREGRKPSFWCPTQEVHGDNDVHVTLDATESEGHNHRVNWHDNHHAPADPPEHKDVRVLGWRLK